MLDIVVMVGLLLFEFGFMLVVMLVWMFVMWLLYVFSDKFLLVSSVVRNSDVLVLLYVVIFSC